MELLFATLFGAAIGLGVSVFTPGRTMYGSLLVPAVSAAVTAMVWVGLVWLGWTFDAGWIWVVSLLAAAIAAAAIALTVPRRRRRSDDAMLHRLSKA